MVSELLKAVLKNGGNLRVSVLFLQIFKKGGQVFVPGGIGIFRRAKKDVEGCFRLPTAGAGIIRLFTPLVKGDSHTAILGGVLGNP